MEKQTVMHFLMQAVQGVKETQNALLTLIGYFNKDELNNVVKDSTYSEHSQFYNLGNGYGNQPTSTLEEIKAMIVELHIKGSVRKRPDGRFEYRSALLGSIYGFTKEEIEQKITQKLKEVKKNKGKPIGTKKEIPLLSEFFISKYLPYKRQTLAERSI